MRLAYLISDCICCARLASKGLKVLVERSVHAKEFPEYDSFDPEQNGRRTLS